MISKFRGAIIGTAIGDALGAPLETMWADDIAKNYPQFNEETCEYVSKGARKKGEWTDDTQLMIPTAWSIIFKSGIHPADIAQQYVELTKNEEKRGWGRSTIQSVQRLSEGSQWFEASEESLGIGNGAAMKAAPLGLTLAHICSTGSPTDILHCLNSIVDVGKITHKDAGIRGGFLQSILIALAVRDVKSTKAIISDLRHCEREFFGDDSFSKKAELLIKHNSIRAICDAGGVTSKAEESWPSTAAIYIKIANTKNKAISAMFELIKQGGDCDTTGAMLGALIGARFGMSIFPQKLFRNLEKSNSLRNLADALYDALINSSNAGFRLTGSV